jgi:hypothetical protein
MPEEFGRREEKRLVCAFRDLEPLLENQGRLSNNQLKRISFSQTSPMEEMA